MMKDKKGKIIKNILEKSIFVVFCFACVSILALSQLANLVPIILSVLFSVLVFVYVLLYGKFTINYSIGCFALFVIYASLITCIVSKDFQNLKTYITTISLMFVAFEFFVNLPNPKTGFYLLLISVFVFSLIYIGFAIYTGQLFDFVKGIETRVGFPIDNPNSLGTSILLAFCLNLAMIIIEKKRLYFWMPMLFVFLFCIALSGSRMAVLGTIISLIVFLIVLLKEKHKLILVFALAGIVALSVLVISLPVFASIKNRILSMFSMFSGSGGDYSSESRLSMLITGLQYWLKYSITGMGAGGFAYVSSHSGYSHATISELLCNFGIIGSCLFFAPQVQIFMSSPKNSDVRRVSGIYLLGFVIIGLVGTVLLTRKLLYIFLSILFALYTIETKKKLTSIGVFMSNKRISFSFTEGEVLLKLKNDVKWICLNESQDI